MREKKISFNYSPLPGREGQGEGRYANILPSLHLSPQRGESDNE
jgi:hypothetical protein